MKIYDIIDKKKKDKISRENSKNESVRMSK